MASLEELQAKNSQQKCMQDSRRRWKRRDRSWSKIPSQKKLDRMMGKNQKNYLMDLNQLRIKSLSTKGGELL